MTRREQSLLAQIEEEVLSDGSLATALRKCLALGGQAGSTDLREWSSRELKGYGPAEELPSYRVIPAVIKVDAIRGNYHVTGQQISPRQLPDVAQDKLGEEVRLLQGVGEIEALADRAASEKGGVRLALPGAVDLAGLMNYEAGDPYQQIHAVYWSVSEVPLRGLLDHVRTVLMELVAEMRAGMAGADDIPSPALADQAVSIVVHGNKSRVTVNTAQTSGGGTTSVSPAAPEDSGFWTAWRKAGAFVAGLASIIGLVFAIALWQNWL